MKSILISIKPKWVAKILNGEKTIEIRKTMPKCELPIDVYIYCTKDKNGWCMIGKNGNETYFQHYDKNACYSVSHHYIGNSEVVAKFTLNKVEKIEIEWHDENHFYYTYRTKDLEYRDFFAKSGLFLGELETYINNRKSYAWHISNLEIFDKPKELSEFKKLEWHDNITNISGYNLAVITKAPQSYMFIETGE